MLMELSCFCYCYVIEHTNPTQQQHTYYDESLLLFHTISCIKFRFVTSNETTYTTTTTIRIHSETRKKRKRNTQQVH